MSKILDILKKTGAFINDGHFVFNSGRHAAIYMNKDALYVHPKETSAVCRMFAETAKDLGVETVVGPALGGIVLSQWTAFHLSEILGKEVFATYTEKTEDGGQKFTRGYEKFISGKKILIAEDSTSTGSSAKKSLNAVRAAGGEVVGVCVMLNRNPKEVSAEYFGVPFFPLDTFEVQTYSEADCPMCKSGLPINTTVGHGKKFLEEREKGPDKNITKS